MSRENPKPTNEEMVDEITRDFESQFSVDSAQKEENVASKIADEQSKAGIPEDFDSVEPDECKDDDYIDELQLKDIETTLTEDDLEARHREALELKSQGNEEFKTEHYLESVATYSKALRLCPLKHLKDRSVLYANRAASKAKLARTESAIEDCTKAIELDDTYLKAYMRRAKLYEETEKLDESLADYKKILEFDRSNKEALQAQYRLPHMIEERNEKLKTEMLGIVSKVIPCLVVLIQLSKVPLYFSIQHPLSVSC